MSELCNQSMFIKPRRVTFPYSWIGHIPFASWLIEEMKPCVLVELGTHSGNSYLAFCQTVQAQHLPTKCYAVDLWSGDEHAGFYNEKIFDELSNYHKENYSKFSRLLKMSFDDALKEFEDGTVDFLHIDGLHTYEAVKHDYETWLPKMSKNGVILFHDIAVKERGFGVWKLWDELKAEYCSVEFPHSHGLGAIFLGKELSSNIERVICLSEPAQTEGFIIKAFIQMGEDIVIKYKQAHMLAEKDKSIQETIKKFEGSVSWRITKPLRWLKTWVK